MRPVVLTANTPRSFYRGTGRIHRFRGLPAPADEYHPEDWIASTTARFGSAPLGLTTLPDGRDLASVIADEPEAWLGAAHVKRYGADPALLVKLLDAGQRLPLHVHPDRRFATAHLASPYGKTEAWVIVDAVPDASVHLGFRRDVAPDELAGSVRGIRPGVDRLFPAAADEFFSAERLRPDPVSVLDPGFCVVIVVTGAGSLTYTGETLGVAAGATVVVPYGAGAGELRGHVPAIRCRPPTDGGAAGA